MPSFSNDNGNVYQACSDTSQTEETLLDNLTVTYKQNEYELNDSISLVNDSIEKSFNLDHKNDPRFVLNELRTKNLDRPIIACININFLENKFEPLKSITKENIDILLVSETKLDDTFPLNQFEIEGYSAPIRLDRNCLSGGIMFFIRDDLPNKELELHNLHNSVDAIFLEITLRKNKWLIIGGYNPHKGSISFFLNNIGKELDKVLPSYDNILIMGDFNSTVLEKEMQEFCEIYGLENLIKDPTCYKNPSNPSSIDVMLTNKISSFQDSITLETGLSDHHKMTITVLKRYFKKRDPITVKYRNYKLFDSDKFRHDIEIGIEKLNTLSIKDFNNVFMTVLNSHAPIKTKILRGNNAPFMNKTLSKEFMHRSKLKNKYHKNPTEINKLLYKKQRNFCVNLLRKQKKNYYNNSDIKIFADNRKFWQRIKPLFSEKNKLCRNITLVENGIIISDKLLLRN